MVEVNRITIAGFVAFEPKAHPKATSFTLNFVQGWGDRMVWDHVRVVAFGQLAEDVARLGKGVHVLVEGQFQISRWLKDDVEMSVPQVVASSVSVVTLERPRLPINGRTE